MKKILLVCMLASAFGISIEAQQSQQTAQQFNVAPINQAPNVTNANAVSDFEAGSTVRFYWIVTHLGGVASIPIQTSDRLGPVTLSNTNGNRVTITWTTPNINATFDVLETATSTLPLVANCNCAVQIGITGTSVIDIGTYSSYNTAFPQGFSWNISQNYLSNIPSLNFFYNGTLICAIAPNGGSTCGAPSSATVSSVGLALPPPVMGVSGSPVTTSGTLTGFWNQEISHTVFAGPASNSVGGVIDSSFSCNSINNNNCFGPTNTITLPGTSTQSFDLAIAIAVTGQSPSQPSALTMTGSGTWTNLISNGNFGGLFYQTIASASSIAPVATSGAVTPNWAGTLTLLKAFGPGSSLIQSQSVTGSLNGGNNAVFSSNTTAGNSVMACVFGNPGGVPAAQINDYFVTDSQNNLYTPISEAIITGASNNGASTVCWLTNNVAAAADTVTFQVRSGSGISGVFVAMEWSKIVLDNATPTFRLLTASDLPALTPASVMSAFVQSTTFSSKNLASNVSVTANTTTTVDSITVSAAGGAAPSFPNSTGPFRVQVCYSYFSTAGTGVTGETQVSDGTNIFAGGGDTTSSGGTAYGNCGWSPVTYTGVSSITFTVSVRNTGAETISTVSPILAQASHMAILVHPSN